MTVETKGAGVDEGRETALLVTFQGRAVKFEVRNDKDHQQRRWLQGHFYEQPFLAWLLDNVSAGVVYDIGASIGNHSIFFASIMGAKVYAFEPHGPSYDHLVKNVTWNDADVTAMPYLVSHISGSTYGEIPAPDGNAGMTRYEPKVGGWSHRAVNIDELVHRDIIKPPDLMKIDVEGLEYEVVQGARATIDAYRPVLAVECIGSRELHNIDTFLADYGYTRRPEIHNATPTYVWEP